MTCDWYPAGSVIVFIVGRQSLSYLRPEFMHYSAQAILTRHDQQTLGVMRDHTPSQLNTHITWPSRGTQWQPFDTQCYHVGTAVKHPVQDRVKLSILTSGHSDAKGRVSECPDVKNHKWRLNPVWHRIPNTHMATVDVKGLIYQIKTLCTISTLLDFQDARW